MVMASALLARRIEEPCWSEGKVYTRTNPNPNPNSTPPRQTIEPAALPTASTSAAASDDPKSLYRRKETGRRYVTYNVSNYSKEGIRELKRKMVSELELVRRVTSRIESTAASPDSVVVQSTRKPPSAEMKKLTAGMMKWCSQILTKLMKHVWFRAPVEVVALKLYDYHQIIKNPMDLGTVRSRLSKGLYPSPADFAADVRLTFNNALIYNPPGYNVHMFAGLLLRQFESSFVSAYQRHEKQLMAATYQAEVTEREEQKLRFASSWSRPPAAMLPESQTWVEQRVGRTITSPSPEQSVAPPLPQEQQQQKKKSRRRPMSLAEKERLTSDLEELPEEKTEQLLQIIRKRNVDMVESFSGLGSSGNGEEVDIDFELMDNETLWELARYVSYCKKQKKSNLNESVPPGGHVLLPLVAQSPKLMAAAAAAKKSGARMMRMLTFVTTSTFCRL